MKFRMIVFVLLVYLLVAGPLAAQNQMAGPDLRIGALPVLNMLPLYVAHDAGYFDEAGVVVEIVDFLSSKAAQDAAIAGEIDGFQADLVSALVVNEQGANVRVVRHVGITNIPFVSIIAGRDSGIESVADLAGRQIGLSQDTIIQYLTNSLLASAGMSADDVEYVDTPGIYHRLQLLSDGEIDAATLPEPYATAATLLGNRILIDDTGMDYVPETLNISADTLAEKGEAVSAFLAAYEQAVATINAMAGDIQTYLDFNAANDRGSGQALKSSLATRFIDMPTLSQARVPSEAEFSGVHDWALGAGLISEAQAYADAVTGQFLPEVRVEELAADDEMAEEAAAPTAEADQEMREADLRIVVRPSIYSLPFHIAQGAGYFEEEGVVVELVEILNVASLLSAVEAGEFDGLQLTSLNRILQLNAGAGDVRIVREVAVTNLPFFALITGPGSGIASMEDLRGAAVSLVAGADAEFFVGQMLAHAGLSADEVAIDYIDPAEVGDMFDDILGGQIQVTFADQVFSQSISMFGGSVLMDSDDLNYDGAQEIIGFRAQVLEEQGDAVRAFLRALARAEEALNAMEGDTQEYRHFVGDRGIEQDALVETLVIGGFSAVPMFAPPGVPSAGEIASVQEWALEMGLLDASIAYDDLVDGSFLMEEMAEE